MIELEIDLWWWAKTIGFAAVCLGMGAVLAIYYTFKDFMR